MQIRRWRHINWKLQFVGWLQGFGELADAIVTICSFGFLCSTFEMGIAVFRSRLEMLERQKKTHR